jgi:hypothetical protein
VVARRKLGEWHETMSKLVPQIRYWLRTGFVAAGKVINLHIPSFAVQAVEQIATLFGRAPRSYAYDRAGDSARNVERLHELGVRDVGLAPRGKTPWEVEGIVKARLIKERALVEGRSEPSSPPSTDSIARRPARLP